MRATHLICTGGTGYIGSRLVERALRDGRAVTLLGSSSRSAASVRAVPWRLGDPLPAAALAGIADGDRPALVHLAHDWNRADEDDVRGNVGGTARLFAEAAALGIETRVFVSSQSAREDAPNRYGRAKWRAEQRLGPSATALRVGLVYGGPRVAMYGLLARLAALGILPMVEPRRLVQPIHRDEVVDGILAAADRGAAGGVLGLAGACPRPFGDVLKELAAALHGRPLAVVPVPLRLALLACDAVRLVLPRSRLDRERVLGLVGTRPMDVADDLAALGVAVAPVGERLAGEPAGRRALLREGAALLAACLGRRPPSSLSRRYARAAGGAALARPPLPAWLLRWSEPFGAGPLAGRFGLAARIVEASPEGESMLAGGSRSARLGRIAAALVLEGLALPLRLLSAATRP